MAPPRTLPKIHLAVRALPQQDFSLNRLMETHRPWTRHFFLSTKTRTAGNVKENSKTRSILLALPPTHPPTSTRPYPTQYFCCGAPKGVVVFVGSTFIPRHHHDVPLQDMTTCGATNDGTLAPLQDPPRGLPHLVCSNRNPSRTAISVFPHSSHLSTCSGAVFLPILLLLFLLEMCVQGVVCVFLPVSGYLSAVTVCWPSPVAGVSVVGRERRGRAPTIEFSKALDLLHLFL